MRYIDGFVCAVESGKKQAFIDHAKTVDALFLEFGALRVAEGWGDDVPEGKLTDFRRAVDAMDGEEIVFSWIEWPDKTTRDAAMKRMMDDARMQGPMPFDGKRMIYGGFAPMLDESSGANSTYVDGFIVPVPDENRVAYRELAAKSWPVFREHGAVRHLEAWGDEVSDGKVTDFNRAVQKKDGESVVFSYIGWPDQATRAAAWPRVMRDERMQSKPDEPMPFDDQRMLWGGFAILFELEK